MNLWRRSKSWFHDGFSVQKDVFDPQCYLDQEKELLEQKYARDKELLEQSYQKQLARLKERFDSEARHLREKHSHLNDRGKSSSSTRHRPDSIPITAKHFPVEGDGLEWDPSDELKSYSEDEASDSWDVQSNDSQSSLNWETPEESETPDSAYSSLSSFAGPSFGHAQNDMEHKFELVRAGVRLEVVKECEEKFRQERKFFYSIIDELEESVSLLRKRKEDIVSILEREAKGSENE